MPTTNDPTPPAPGDAHLSPGERSLAEALQRERRRVRRLRALPPLLVLALAGAAAMAVLWRDAVAESRRMADQTLSTERARMEAERQRDLAQVAAKRARADAEAARLRKERADYAHTIHLAQQAWSAQDTHRAAVELLEGVPPERRGWEWLPLSRRPAPPPGAKQ